MADALVLEEALAVVGGLPLELPYDEPLQALHVLVRRARHLEERRRHGRASETRWRRGEGEERERVRERFLGFIVERARRRRRRSSAELLLMSEMGIGMR